MTLQDLITRVRYNIGELQEGYWNNSEIIININKAIDDLNFAIETVSKNKTLKNTVINTIAGQAEYQLPNDFSSLFTIKQTDGKILFNRITMTSQMFQDALNYTTDTSLFSSMYYDIYNKIVNGVSGKYIKFAPIPNTQLVIEIEYNSKIPNLSLYTDDLGIYDKYSGYIEDKATYYTLLKGPSGNYDEFNKNSEIKLNRILSALKDNEFKSEFVQGYLED